VCIYIFQKFSAGYVPLKNGEAWMGEEKRMGREGRGGEYKKGIGRGAKKGRR
jgi:hypothetical protein